MNQSGKEFRLRLAAALALLAVLFGLAHHVTEGKKPSFKFQSAGGGAAFTPWNDTENEAPPVVRMIDAKPSCRLPAIPGEIGDGRNVARAIADAANVLDADSMESLLAKLRDTSDYRKVNGWLGNLFADSLETYNRFGQKANRTLVNTLLGDGMGWTLQEKVRFERELLRMGLVRRSGKWALSFQPDNPDGTKASLIAARSGFQSPNRRKLVGNHPVRAGT